MLQMNTAPPKLKLTWYVPRWAYTRQLWSQFDHVLNSASLIRIGLGIGIVSVAVIVAFKCAIPQLALPNLWPMVFAFPALLLAVSVISELLCEAPFL